jgi:cytochrome P450
MHISRYIPTSQTISTAKGDHLILGPAKVYINTAGLHLNTTTWGPDAWSFDPARWILSSSSQTPELITPAKGTFLPWSGGPRICPGMKMAQVEFVAVIATLFKFCRAEVVLREGETGEQARVRLEKLMQESQPRLTLQMQNPEDVVLRWATR